MFIKCMYTELTFGRSSMEPCTTARGWLKLRCCGDWEVLLEAFFLFLKGLQNRCERGDFFGLSSDEDEDILGEPDVRKVKKKQSSITTANSSCGPRWFHLRQDSYHPLPGGGRVKECVLFIGPGDTFHLIFESSRDFPRERERCA